MAEKDANDFHSDPLTFASLIAHQLQSPLNAVSIALNAVLGEYTGPLLPQQRGPLERASQRCDQAVAAVRRMLAIIRAGHEESGTWTPASLESTIRQVYQNHAEDAARSDVIIDLDLEAGDVAVPMAEAALTEVCSALLSNALKYTPPHGRVVVATRRAANSERVVLSVADSGMGIPLADRARVFEPFFRTANARGSANQGVGLGLAFVKSVVTAAGGTVVSGQSELGGALFTVDLSLVGPEAVAASARRGKRSMHVVIIGGVTAGPKAAAKLIRLMPDAEVTIVDRGSVLSYAGCGLPYYVSGVVREQRGLISSPAGVVRDPVFFRRVMNVHVLNRTDAREIDPKGKRVRLRDEQSGHETWLSYDKLVLATGASAQVPPVLQGSLKNVFTLHGVRDAEGIRTALASGTARDVVIVGGGLIGIEMTEALVRKGARVTILEQRDQILPILDVEMARLVAKHLETHGVRIVTHANALGLEGDDEVTGVRTDKGVFAATLVVLACGIQPNTKLPREAGLALGESGAVRVDERMQTSDPDILAAGDCVETVHRVTGKPFYCPMGSTAMKQGRIAGITLSGGEDSFPGVLATSICQVFGYCAARTGLGEAEARAHGYDVETVLAAGPDRAHFMPAAKPLLVKLVVDRETRKLLGAQIVGLGAGDKRLDVAAMAIATGTTIDDLAQMDLGYSPSYSTAMDNLITAANIARNKMAGMYTAISAEELRRMMGGHEDFMLLDVRTPQEYEEHRLPGATLIALGALRGRLAEVVRGKTIVTYCDIGLRAYEAALMLRAAGIHDVRVLEGGMAMWPFELVT